MTTDIEKVEREVKVYLARWRIRLSRPDYEDFRQDVWLYLLEHPDCTDVGRAASDVRRSAASRRAHRVSMVPLYYILPGEDIPSEEMVVQPIDPDPDGESADHVLSWVARYVPAHLRDTALWLATYGDSRYAACALGLTPRTLRRHVAELRSLFPVFQNQFQNQNERTKV